MTASDYGGFVVVASVVVDLLVLFLYPFVQSFMEPLTTSPLRIYLNVEVKII